MERDTVLFSLLAFYGIAIISFLFSENNRKKSIVEKEKKEKEKCDEKEKKESSCGQETCGCKETSSSSSSSSNSKTKNLDKKPKKTKKDKEKEKEKEKEILNTNTNVKIFYGTQTGTTKKLSQLLSNELTSKGIGNEISDFSSYEAEDFANEKSNCIFILSTYEGGEPTQNSKWFYEWLEFSANDFRVHRTFLAGLKFTVFALGNSLYKEHYNTCGRNVDKWLHKLSAKRFYKKGEGDVDNEMEKSFEIWKNGLVSLLVSNTKEKVESERKEEVEDFEYSDEEEENESQNFGSEEEENLDVEDLGSVASKIQKAKKDKQLEEDNYEGSEAKISIGSSSEIKEMVTPMLREALTKQGYSIIGSHSGVKMCRWTKAMMRGRGGCYKFSFYGIHSHRCMETTPSLACANKCVFCWRHHTNPVGTKWRWKMDDPKMILDGAIENHYRMVKQMKGVPGVKEDRYEEAFKIRHCALSLVGEPIMYPKINEFVDLLHEKEISTFLVTNAQFPEQILNLKPVTQLYVSVDASTKESLKKIDRPLFKDFWQRFIGSLSALATKGQRTVYRLTLVKDYNVDEINNYAELVSLGNPDFIEVKGVTFCGTSGASSLTMNNVPFHHEVVKFCQELSQRLGGKYGVACEHEHSCCVLIANKKFLIDGKWNTWINYDKFHSLVKSGQPFTSLDYIQETPEWAILGHSQHGFNPADTRHFRKSKKDDEEEEN